MDRREWRELRSWRTFTCIVDGIKILLLLIIVSILLSGCKSQPGAEPVLTPQEIVETPDKKKSSWCLKLENLPKCAGYYVIEYRNRLGGCIWNARCMSRSF